MKRRALLGIWGILSIWLWGFSACRGCGDDDGQRKTVSPSPSHSGVLESSDGGSSPFSLVLSSGSELSFSGFWGGVWIGISRKYAQALGDSELQSAEMPSGLPEGNGHIIKVMGRLPGSLWLSYANMGEGGKIESEPLFKLMRGNFKRIAEDWHPHLLSWSKKRILALSTSSGRLKIKLMEPYSDKAPSDMPGAWLKDESCANTLKVHGAVALSKGDVFAAGNCRPEGASGLRYVVLRWPPAPEEEAKEEKARFAQPSARGTVNPEDAWPVASADMSPDGGMAEEKQGLPAEAMEMPNAARNLVHKMMVTDGNLSVLALAWEGGGKEGNGQKAHLYRLEGESFREEALPDKGEALHSISAEPDGTLWAVNNRMVLKRAPGAAWEELPLPARGAEFSLDGIWVSGPKDIWVWGHSAAGGPDAHWVLRTKPAGNPIRW